jgi:outer membrane cobalamin receptor
VRQTFALIVGVFLVSAVWAQTQAGATNDAYRLDEVVVTATKTATNLQRTAMSVTAVTGCS